MKDEYKLKTNGIGEYFLTLVLEFYLTKYEFVSIRRVPAHKSTKKWKELFKLHPLHFTNFKFSQFGNQVHFSHQTLMWGTNEPLHSLQNFDFLTQTYIIIWL